MDLTSWPQVQPINQKNYYVDFLKRDEQLLAVRMQQEEARNRMVKNAKDRDRALSQGKQPGQDGDVDMDDEDDDVVSVDALSKLDQEQEAQRTKKAAEEAMKSNSDNQQD